MAAPLEVPAELRSDSSQPFTLPPTGDASPGCSHSVSERRGRGRADWLRQRCRGSQILGVISVPRNSQLSSPGNLPSNRPGGEGLSGSSGVRAGHAEARSLPVSLSLRMWDNAHPLSPVRDFWGQLQMDS